jgi:hypothetical protein
METMGHNQALGKRPFILLLVTAVLLAAPSQVSPMQISSMTMTATAPHDRPAGCHEHASQVPAPQPASYKCCLTGHDSALLHERGSVRPSSLSLIRTIASDQLSPVIARFDVSPPLLTPSDTSPGLVPQRV